MQWIYRFASNSKYPDPLEEISALSALQEEGDESFLLLNDRAHPPLCASGAGETIGLCTAVDNRLILHGLATIKSTPFHGSTPLSVQPLYGQQENRFFCPLSDISLGNPAQLLTSILSDEDQYRFTKGQASAKRLGPKVQTRTTSHVNSDWTDLFRPAATNVSQNVEQVVVGLDPTAGTWDSCMTEGPKPMPSFALRLNGSGIHAIDVPLATHSSNEEFWKRVEVLAPSTVCIDGPCQTNGPRCTQEWHEWDRSSPNGFRNAERALSADGVKLFWTTMNTVLGFDGASRWIARSLRLFSHPSRAKVIETHPHGVFTFLARAYGWHNSLPRKTTGEGRAARIALLKAFVPNLEADMMPDHDAIDAACAALVAALYCRGEVVSFGTHEEGGLIWMPRLHRQMGTL